MESAHYNLGNDLFVDGKYNEAIDQFSSQCLQANPDSGKCFAHLKIHQDDNKSVQSICGVMENMASSSDFIRTLGTAGCCEQLVKILGKKKSDRRQKEEQERLAKIIADRIDIMEVSRSGDIAGVIALLESGVDPNSMSGYYEERSSGGYCAYNGQRGYVHVKHGDFIMGTPLHMAAKIKNIDMIQILLDRGADIKARDQKNVRAGDVAFYTCGAPISRLLRMHTEPTSEDSLLILVILLKDLLVYHHLDCSSIIDLLQFMGEVACTGINGRHIFEAFREDCPCGASTQISYAPLLYDYICEFGNHHGEYH